MARLRFARIKGVSIDKNLEKIHDELYRRRIHGARKREEGALKGLLFCTNYGSYLYIMLYKEFKKSAELYDESIEDLKKKHHPESEKNAIVILRNNLVAFEVTHDFRIEDMQDMLLSFFKIIGFSNTSFELITSFNLKIMREFYNDVKVVKHLKVKKIGKIKPNPRIPPEDIKRATQDMGENVSRLQADAGKDGNLRESKVIEEGIAKLSYILEVRGSDEFRKSFTAIESGIVDTPLPSEHERKASKLYTLTEKIFRFLQ